MSHANIYCICCLNCRFSTRSQTHDTLLMLSSLFTENNFFGVTGALSPNDLFMVQIYFSAASVTARKKARRKMLKKLPNFVALELA